MLRASRKQNYKARKLQLSSKSAKELKVKTHEAFVHSNESGRIAAPNHESKKWRRRILLEPWGLSLLLLFLPKTKFIRECQASVKESISEVHKKDDL